ncbi:hypothetical protein BKA70DRAFT_1439317 [Coprinopsis sp. MPI-PUGE-AT-0042]|nr:hypothetical protein BKA70DRAFT_1439317 [Coprinopsis sp. MPI-PUGE-AT-0042]
MKRSRRVMGVVREELHQQAEYLQALEAKNVKVTRELPYLQERKQSIELDELKEKVIRLEAGIEAGRLEREAWASKTLDTSSNNTPSSVTISVTQALTDLRITHATPSSWKSKVRLPPPCANAPLKLRLSNLKTRKTRNPSRSSKRRRASRRRNGENNALTTPSVDQVKVDKVEELETLLAEYENVNDQLTNDLGALEGLMVSTEELERVEQEKKAPRQTISKHEQEIPAQATKIDELEQALFDPSREIAAGRHVPPRTRVLCTPENPDQAWVDLGQTTMDRLKGDNEALVKRLKELEESRVSSNTASRIWRRAEVAGCKLCLSVLRPNTIPRSHRGYCQAFVRRCQLKLEPEPARARQHGSKPLHHRIEVEREVFFAGSEFHNLPGCVNSPFDHPVHLRPKLQMLNGIDQSIRSNCIRRDPSNTR